MTEQDKIKEAFETIIEMCGITPCEECPMSYIDCDGDYLCNLERNAPHACKLREVKVFEPHWEEFNIEDGGFFLAEGSNYLWWQWCRFLDMNGEKYNAFGGWLHPDDDDWCMIPMCYIDNQLCTYCDRDKTTKPAIPIKIRFWRYQE